MIATTIQADVDGHTINEFAELLKQRQRWMLESTEDSVVASAIQILTSLRTLTKVAQVSHTKIEVVDMPGFRLAFTMKGGKKVPCLRIGRARYTKPQGTVIKYNSVSKVAKVFEFVYKRPNGKVTKYLLVEDSLKDAKDTAKKMVKTRTDRYKGLARRAIGKLMYKTSTLNPKEEVSSKAEVVADENTKKTEHKRKTNDGLDFSLTLEDDLRYAISSLQHGKGDIDLAMKKASNKVASILNAKCGNILGFKKIDTPFPEVRGKKK